MPLAASAITGLVLAGGQGQRMGGRDKGLIELNGRLLVDYVIERLKPQVATLIVCANRNQMAYQALGFPVIHDSLPDYPGPLAGILAGLDHCTTRWLATAPCDCPFLPTDFVAKLAAVATTEDTIAVASAQGELQPVFALIPRALRDALERFLQTGERKITRWYAQYRMVPVEFDAADAFDNLNTEADRARALNRLSHGQP
ncbi:MAG: molybdenum cofactor guanylyltransferase [Gammaproteobacteria bacterium]|nr:molybdenum cofactor guanylyltransferase [Gammaproteobacteria bacterium]